VGDFFSQHYLDQLREKDLGELLSTWAARENTKRRVKKTTARSA
jgi:hypothetical protein